MPYRGWDGITSRESCFSKSCCSKGTSVISQGFRSLTLASASTTILRFLRLQAGSTCKGTDKRVVGHTTGSVKANFASTSCKIDSASAHASANESIYTKVVQRLAGQ